MEIMVSPSLCGVVLGLVLAQAAFVSEFENVHPIPGATIGSRLSYTVKGKLPTNGINGDKT